MTFSHLTLVLVQQSVHILIIKKHCSEATVLKHPGEKWRKKTRAAGHSQLFPEGVRNAQGTLVICPLLGRKHLCIQQSLKLWEGIWEGWKQVWPRVKKPVLETGEQKCGTADWGLCFPSHSSWEEPDLPHPSSPCKYRKVQQVDERVHGWVHCDITCINKGNNISWVQRHCLSSHIKIPFRSCQHSLEGKQAWRPTSDFQQWGGCGGPPVVSMQRR